MSYFVSFINNLYRRFDKLILLFFPKLHHHLNKYKLIIKFFFAGLFSGTTDLILLFIFHGYLKIDIIIATSLSFIGSLFVSFTLQKLWTFHNYNQSKVIHQFVLYVLNASLAFYLNGLFMNILVNKYDIWYILAQIMVNLILAIMNFVVYKFIIFKIGANEIESK